MTDRRRIMLWLLGWTAVITTLHFAMNVNWSVLMNDMLPLDKRKLNVAYIPVT